MQHAPAALQADKGVVLVAVAQDGHALWHAAPALKADPDFLMGKLNRATCFIMVRGFGACAEDCDDIMR